MMLTRFKADFVIANPPLNDSYWGKELLRKDVIPILVKLSLYGLKQILASNNYALSTYIINLIESDKLNSSLMFILQICKNWPQI